MKRSSMPPGIRNQIQTNSEKRMGGTKSWCMHYDKKTREIHEGYNKKMDSRKIIVGLGELTCGQGPECGDLITHSGDERDKLRRKFWWG